MTAQRQVVVARLKVLNDPAGLIELPGRPTVNAAPGWAKPKQVKSADALRAMSHLRSAPAAGGCEIRTGPSMHRL
jgi:hypothetical protein